MGSFNCVNIRATCMANTMFRNFTVPRIAIACRTLLTEAERPYAAEFTIRNTFPASTASFSIQSASSVNITSSRARVAINLASTGLNRGS